MGDAADYQNDVDENRMLWPFGVFDNDTKEILKQNRNVIANSTWRTLSGDIIKFKDMDLTHLRNVVAMIETRGHKHATNLRDYYDYRLSQKEQ